MDCQSHENHSNAAGGDGISKLKPVRQQDMSHTSADSEPDGTPPQRQSLRAAIGSSGTDRLLGDKRQKLTDDPSRTSDSVELVINNICSSPVALGNARESHRRTVSGEIKDRSTTGTNQGDKSAPAPLPESNSGVLGLPYDEGRLSPTLKEQEHSCVPHPSDPEPAVITERYTEPMMGEIPQRELRKSGKTQNKENYPASMWVGGEDGDHRYTRGPARMVKVTSADGEGGTFALQLSHELSEKLKKQIEAGRKFRHAREAVGRRLVHLLAEDARLIAEHSHAKREADSYLDGLGERVLTPEEESKATVMVKHCNDIAHKHAATKKEREQLPRYLQEIQNTWVKLVEEVNAIQEDVFVKTKLVPATTELERLPWEQSQDGGTDVVAPNSVPRVQELELANMKQSVEATRPGLAMRNRFTKAALEVAREKHDKYRLGYEKELQEYIAKQVNRPNVDFRIEFSRKWLEGWHDVIVTLEEAENAAQDAFDRARAANVTVADSRDDGVPTIAYDIEWWDKTSLKQLDRTRIQRWQNEVVVGVLGPTHPAGSDEVELEQLSKVEHLNKQTEEPAIDNSGGAPVNPSERQPAAGSEGVSALPPLGFSKITATTFQKIEQLLAEVAGALDRASELTSLQAQKPDLASAATGAEADEVNKRTSAVLASSSPREAFADVGAESRMAEVIDKPRQVVSQGNPGTQNTAQNVEEPQTSKGRTEQAIVSEPTKRQDGEEMESQCDTDLKGYMEKYNIQPPPVSRKRDRDNSLDQRDAIITASERAYGSRRRRIDKWGKYIRGGDC
ncbi:uncharacterized protein J4E78_007458 [Alternaria triticimaculans]|uniref:uncharacterized protein n=1 Tax=Alternaria triticimaculans TaxID=297637 RepID=UPI0020C3261D|nr:uncharacterized protein J4E78_007458 [Alternaria triticimaculans]KAI4654412.1 hypothetical protein J4E78_007458 [Alternaria triticimaculans]